MTPEQADAVLRTMQEIKTLLAGLESQLKHQAVMAKYTGLRFSLPEEYETADRKEP